MDHTFERTQSDRGSHSDRGELRLGRKNVLEASLDSIVQRHFFAHIGKGDMEVLATWASSFLKGRVPKDNFTTKEGLANISAFASTSQQATLNSYIGVLASLEAMRASFSTVLGVETPTSDSIHSCNERSEEAKCLYHSAQENVKDLLGFEITDKFWKDVNSKISRFNLDHHFNAKKDLCCTICDSHLLPKDMNSPMPSPSHYAAAIELSCTEVKRSAATCCMTPAAIEKVDKLVPAST